MTTLGYMALRNEPRTPLIRQHQQLALDGIREEAQQGKILDVNFIVNSICVEGVIYYAEEALDRDCWEKEACVSISEITSESFMIYNEDSHAEGIFSLKPTRSGSLKTVFEGKINEAKKLGPNLQLQTSGINTDKEAQRLSLLIKNTSKQQWNIGDAIEIRVCGVAQKVLHNITTKCSSNLLGERRLSL